MDIQQIFPYVLIGLGLITIFGYITNNKKMFWKRDKMKQFWGERLGTAIHFISYALGPIAVGIFMLLR